MKEELAIRAAKLFTPKPWKHNSKPRPNKCCGLYCTKCKVEFTKQNGELDKPCTVPAPIDINDWNVAMKMVRSVNQISVGMVEVYNNRYKRGLRHDIEIESLTACAWFTSPICQIEHWAEAACITKEAENV